MEAASLPEDNLKNKAFCVLWQRAKVTGAPQIAGDQAGFETEPAQKTKE
jgi:hypothetical protein